MCDCSRDDRPYPEEAQSCENNPDPQPDPQPETSVSTPAPEPPPAGCMIVLGLVAFGMVVYCLASWLQRHG